MDTHVQAEIDALHDLVEWAERNPDEQSLKAVLNGRIRARWGLTPLEAAHRLNLDAIVGALLDLGAEADAPSTELALCIYHGQGETLSRRLCDGRHNPNATVFASPAFPFRGASLPCPLVHFCLRPGRPESRLDMLEILVCEGGAKLNVIDSRGLLPLSSVPYLPSHREATIRMLARIRANPNYRPIPPLIEWIEALKENERASPVLISCIRELVAVGAKTEGVFDRSGRTPLALAAARGDAGLARLLLELGAPVNGACRHGSTALHWSYDSSVRVDRAEVRSLLVEEAGADVEARDASGRSAAFACARLVGDLDALRQLLRWGASLDVISNGGGTPLMAACEQYDYLDDKTFAAEHAGLMLRHSSLQTRRRVLQGHATSALDVILDQAQHQARGALYSGPQPVRLCPAAEALAADLLIIRVPVSERHRQAAAEITRLVALGRAARVMDNLEVELLRRPIVTSWRGHEAMVKLAFDFRDAREADEALAATRARLREAKRRLRELGEEVSDHEDTYAPPPEIEDEDWIGSGKDEDEAES